MEIPQIRWRFGNIKNLDKHFQQTKIVKIGRPLKITVFFEFQILEKIL